MASVVVGCGPEYCYERYCHFHSLVIFDTDASIVETLPTVSVIPSEDDELLTPQNNYGGWVNPEDLTPMPQCISQQDQSAWLSAMTKCTGKQCTKKFLAWCTHHQWLTQLDCLRTEFSPDLVRGYLPYCDRSILAKAQLYRWISGITGRTWLADVGDANEVQYLSPASLAEGYLDIGLIYKAPTCLRSSYSALLRESFYRIQTSCSFTSSTQHTGNAGRPWEYRDGENSMVALDSQTAGYDLTGHYLWSGDYFDKKCFCGTFTIDLNNEPCPDPRDIDLSRERLWMYATCGPASLPSGWRDKVKTTEFAYIPTSNWNWPKCVADMPEQVTELPRQCTTNACKVDSDGYCIVTRSVDRACFCRDIDYYSCGGSCQFFETRMDYIKWLHNLCGGVQDWHGLPDNWRRLATVIPLDMIPWRWTLKPSNKSSTAPLARLGSTEATESCPSNDSKLGSIILVNIAAFLAPSLMGRQTISRVARTLGHPHTWDWFPAGIFIAALQLLAHWLNALLVQSTLGYEDVPIIQLVLLWCTMPRFAWLTILRAVVQPSKAMSSSAVAPLFAEFIFQFLSFYYMILTINYGSEHGFYAGSINTTDRGRSAMFMYAGALTWLVVALMTLVLLMLVAYVSNVTGSDNSDAPKGQRRGRKNSPAYGTFSAERQDNQAFEKGLGGLYTTAAISMPLLWIAQWIFWIGIICLSSEE